MNFICQHNNNKLRVLMIGPEIEISGGISNVVRNYIQAGFERKVNLVYVPNSPIWKPGSHLLWKYKYFLRAHRELINSLQGSSCDLVHHHISSGLGFIREWMLLESANKYKIPYITHWHASSFRLFENNIIFRIGLKRIISQSIFSIVLSNHMKRCINQITNSAFNQKILVLNNGVNIDEFSRCNNEARKLRKTKTILFMGRLFERKGIYDLIDSIPLVLQRHPDAHFLLCGDGDTIRVRKYTEKICNPISVTIPGYINHKDRVQCFDKADIFTLPSYAEGVPGSLLEAMASKLPLVISPVGGIPEVTDTGHAIYVRPGDVRSLAAGINRLLDDKELAISMGENAYYKASTDLSMEVILNNLFRYYAQATHLVQ